MKSVSFYIEQVVVAARLNITEHIYIQYCSKVWGQLKKKNKKKRF